jgi:outer membrane biosynthesis protein TonB
MILPSNLEEIAHQSEPDIREYKHVLERHSIRFGSPDSFSGFVQKLGGDAEFAKDFWALTYAIQFREKGYLTHEDLFTLLVVSVAGPNLATSYEQMSGLLDKFDHMLAAHDEIKFQHAGLTPALDLTSKAADLKRQPRYLPFPSWAAKIHAQPKKSHHVVVSLIILFVGLASLGRVSAHQSEPGRANAQAIDDENEQRAKNIQTRFPGLNSGNTSHGASTPTVGRQKTAPSIVTGTVQTRKAGSSEKRSVSRAIDPERIQPPLAQARRVDTFDGSCDFGGTPRQSLRQDGNRAMSHRPLSTAYSERVSRRIDLSSGVMASHLVECQPPSYPKLAKLTHVQGPVLLQAVVSGDGAVESVHVIKGPYLLRGAAANAVRTWRYKPYLLDGKGVQVATIVTVDFALKP